MSWYGASKGHAQTLSMARCVPQEDSHPMPPQKTVMSWHSFVSLVSIENLKVLAWCIPGRRADTMYGVRISQEDFDPWTPVTTLMCWHGIS